MNVAGRQSRKEFQTEEIVRIKARCEKMWNVCAEGGCSVVPEAQGAYKEVGEDKARKILPDLESLEFQA